MPKVVVQATITYCVDYPESYAEKAEWEDYRVDLDTREKILLDHVNFHRGESSWCSSNGLDEVGMILYAYEKDENCNVCTFTECTALREATVADESLPYITGNKVQRPK